MMLKKPARAWAWVMPGLLASFVIGAPTTGQFVLQANEGGSQAASHRKLHGRFLHITDLHPDEYYKAHTSTEEDLACHRGNGPAGTYGAEISDCDSPLALVNATFDWITANLKDSIDFVVWTGDSARHDSDEEQPRHNNEILAMNQRIAESFLKTFSDDKGLAVPVVPTFGNNDIYPHNILLPGPNKILKTYTDVWSNFIPEEQRHSFEFGGWFYVEVIPGRLAVFSLNTLYFFDRNAGVDDCAHPSEPGYKQFEWLRIQLQFLRDRGMKAILMGHVPPARTPGKQLWDETCWQKYTLWLQQYRDVIVGSLYGHMNIDHFLLQDTKDIDYSLMEAQSSGRPNVRVSMEEELSAESSKDYLMELREDWAKLPDVREHDNDVEEFGKKKHKKKGGKNKIGGPNAERYQLTLISPSIVPNYFPSLRVFEYNITGLEDTTTWADSIRVSEKKSPLEQDTRELELRREPTMDLEKKKKNKGKGKKGKGGKSPDFQVPDPPAKGALPGPAYLPQPLTLRGFTQYYANLTHINNMAADNLDGDDTSELGRDIGKPPKHDKPKPREFEFQVEYTTFDDKIYKLKDLTVKSVLRLAHRIGQTSDAQSEEGLVEDWDDNEHDEYDDSDNDEDQEELDSEFETDKKKKKGKGKKKHKGHKKNTKVWLHFLRHAFVSTRSKKELEDLG